MLMFNNKRNGKKGFGIMEVLVSIAVLGLLYVAVNRLQTGNRDTLLRIRGRDGAVEVAQQVIDSLGRVGSASIKEGSFTLDNIKRTWKGQPGVIAHDMTVVYSAKVDVAADTTFYASAKSNYDSIAHIYAKRLDVTVSWQFKDVQPSISVSRVIR